MPVTGSGDRCGWPAPPPTLPLILILVLSLSLILPRPLLGCTHPRRPGRSGGGSFLRVRASPHFSPVIYYDTRYTAPCRAFRNSTSSPDRKYASVGQVTKNPTWHGVSGVSLRKLVRSAGKTKTGGWPQRGTKRNKDRSRGSRPSKPGPRSSGPPPIQADGIHFLRPFPENLT